MTLKNKFLSSTSSKKNTITVFLAQTVKNARITPFSKRIFGILLCFLLASPFLNAIEDSSVEYYLSALPQYKEGLRTNNKATLEESVKILLQSHNSNPYYFDVVQTLSRAYYLLRNNIKAREFANKALELHSGDIDAQVLLANLDIQEGNFESAKEAIAKIETENSYHRGLLFTQILYYSILGHYRQASRLLLLFKQVYPEERKIIQMQDLMNAIASNSINFEIEGIVETFYKNSLHDIYVVWLLSEYYYRFYRKDRLEYLLNILLESGYQTLEKASFQKLFTLNIKNSFEKALETARLYTQRYPTDEEAWFELGYSYFYYGYYLDAAIAFKQGYEIDSSNVFLLFMHDIALREGGNALSNIRQLRIDTLAQRAESSILNGNLQLAKEFCRRALLIEPLATVPRYLLANIYQTEGYIDKANEHFSLLQRRKVLINKNIEYYFETNAQKLKDSLQSYRIPFEEKLSIYSWKIAVDENKDEIFGKQFFLHELLLYHLSEHEKISLDNILETVSLDFPLQKEEYGIKVRYRSSHSRFQIVADIYQKRTADSIFTFTATGYGQNRIYNAIKTLSGKINSSLPTVSSFSAIRGNMFLIAGGKNVGITEKTILPIYNRGLIELQDKKPYIYLDSEKLGFAKIKEVFASFSIGEITNVDEQNQETVSRFMLINNSDLGDIVVLEPQNVEFEAKSPEKNLIESDESGQFAALFSTVRFQIW